MLKLITGRAKSGKTAMVMREIKRRAESGERDIVLLVPEQYSHEAERELCRVCGDGISLHAEVLSFTRLSRRVADKLGGTRHFLDKSGRVLAMANALEAVGSRLKVYGAARRGTELQRVLLDALAELKTAHLTPEMLEEEAGRGDDALHDKLADLSLILAGYDAVTARGDLDPGDRLTVLAESLQNAKEMAFGSVYLDGFVDFTPQEREVIQALARRSPNLTLCLTMDGLYEENEVFESSRRTAVWFMALGERMGEKTEHTVVNRENDSPTGIYEKYLFGYNTEPLDDCGKINLLRGDSVADECEFAAATAIALVSGGCRWRDIAVAIRGFERYRPTLEHAFQHYGVPLYVAARSDIMQKPLPMLIASALDAVTGGYDYEDMFAYLKTGLAGLTPEETDLLENYCITWNIRGRAWQNAWTMHPEGYNQTFDDLALERLNRLNTLRRKVIAPMLRFEERGKQATTVSGQAQALTDFLADIALPEALAKRAEALESGGDAALAAEYSQLWGIIVASLEQASLVMGSAETTPEGFGRLYKLMLSQCDVGSIPVSLDRVLAGEMDRMRRRNIRHLIILGASDQRLPRISEGGGIFSPDERRQLSELGLDIGGTAETELSREMNIIYNCVTLPSDTLTITYCPVGEDGAVALPSFVMTRAETIFGKTVQRIDLGDCRTRALAPALELAAGALHNKDPLAAAALEFFRQNGDDERLSKIRTAARAERGSLSGQSVRALYGEKLRLSASRVDKFSACRFAYFLQYGLRAKPRRPAGFNPPQMGSFIHYVLEKVARSVGDQGGFHSIDHKTVDALTDDAIAEYVHEKLNDFQEKTPRFVYLFRRLTKSVRAVVWDMAEELSYSDFVPLDFELSFFGDGQPAVEVGDTPENSAQLVGIADRVDGWIKEGKLYLRVVDYKTGRKRFDLSNIWYGMDLQMLMYLFALRESGKRRYGMPVVPAGVMYVPARDSLVTKEREISDEEIFAEKAKEKRRSGLILNEPELLEAMEHGQEKKFIPIEFKKGMPSGDALATAEQLGLLSRYIDETLKALAAELIAGSITADPYYRSQTENACRNCDFLEACYFDEAKDCRRYLTKLKPSDVWQKLRKKEDDHGQA
ncbi:MAG: PD-(D/E)XK nuclease family protein [Oscillospiraceae bacterium]